MGRGSNPCMVLNSYHQGCQYDLIEERGPPHAKEFTIGVLVSGREYRGKGKSKKLAKQAAAANALGDLYNIRLQLGAEAPWMGATSPPGNGAVLYMPPPGPRPRLGKKRFLIHAHFRSICFGGHR